MHMIYPTRLLPAGFQLAVLLAIVPSISAAYIYPKFLGCLKDDFLGSATFKDPAHLTTSSCTVFCFYKDYPYAGVEYGEDCYCLKDYPRDAYVSSDKCNVKCTGDSSENCGGSGYVGIYWDLIIREENRSPDEERMVTE
ncbi:WSC domain-containing protein [Lactarius vividus]|nr:WSC domain-containing protein [Lactarius vividus]